MARDLDLDETRFPPWQRPHLVQDQDRSDAPDLTRRQTAEPEAGEHIRVELFQPSEVIEAARSGEIQHALALAVIGRELDLWGHLR